MFCGFGKEVHMTHEKSCGAIVYRRYHGNIEILLIKHINSGHWSFPKGHVEEGETEDDPQLVAVEDEAELEAAFDEFVRRDSEDYDAQ